MSPCVIKTPGPECRPGTSSPSSSTSCAILRALEMIIGAWRAAREEVPDLTEREARDALVRLEPLWNELFPAEQARIVQLLVERVDISAEGVRI